MVKAISPEEETAAAAAGAADEQNKDQVALESHDQEPAILKPPGTIDSVERNNQVQFTEQNWSFGRLAKRGMNGDE